MIVEGITDISMAEMKQNVSTKDFKLIAIEECAELQKALTKNLRGYNSVEDYDELLDTLADNLLATQYLIYALGVDKEVLDTIQKKHLRNYNNAMLSNFVYRDKLPDGHEISEKLCLALEKEDKVFFVLTSSYGICVEKCSNDYLVSIKKYSMNNTIEPGEIVYELFNITSKDYLKNKIENLIENFKHFKF